MWRAKMDWRNDVHEMAHFQGGFERRGLTYGERIGDRVSSMEQDDTFHSVARFVGSESVGFVMQARADMTLEPLR
jgi:hypothetical protein